MEAVADFGIITAANDRMLPFLEAWYGNVRTFHPKMPLAVLPFDDDVDLVHRTAERGGIVYCDDITQRWRELGRTIYGGTEYRPGIPRANYLSKLAAFDGPFERFLFLDCNAMVFFNVRRILPKTSPAVIYFMYEALPYANYADDSVAEHYRQLTGYFKFGFNVNFFLASRGRISLDKALDTIADPAGELRPLFGPVPDQSFLTWYAARFHVPCKLARDAQLGIRGWGRKDLSGRPKAPVDPSGRPVHHAKWSGPDFEEGLNNYWLLAHYRPIGQALLALG